MDSSEVVPGSMEDRDLSRFEEKPFPTLDEVLPAVHAEAEIGQYTPYRLEVGILASREVTYKISVKELDETISGVLSV